jgi:CHAP domain
MSKILYKPDEKEEKDNIVLYIKKTKNASYPTKYGLEFQCVELIRRFYSIHKGLTFPDVVDASELFTRITEFTPTPTSNIHNPVKLQTCSFPYTHKAAYYLRPGSIIFWKYTKPDYPYGHVAIIWKNDTETNETFVVQQNLNPPIKRYNTTLLFSKMNCASSKFAGVKLLPREYLTGIQKLECIVHRL